jgi:hypothetical protein
VEDNTFWNFGIAPQKCGATRQSRRNRASTLALLQPRRRGF